MNLNNKSVKLVLIKVSAALHPRGKGWSVKIAVVIVHLYLWRPRQASYWLKAQNKRVHHYTRVDTTNGASQGLVLSFLHLS